VSKQKIPGLDKQPIAVSLTKRRQIISAVCAAQGALVHAVTNTAAARVRSQLNSDSATCKNVNCTDEAVLSAAKLMTAHHSAICCLQCLPATFRLSCTDPSVCSEVTNALMAELLPIYIGCSEIQAIDLQCQAFSTADALMAQLKSHPAFPTADGVALAAHAAADDTLTGTESSPESNTGLAPGYLPVHKNVFEQIQADLLYPCTTDAYASQQTTLCGNFCTA